MKKLMMIAAAVCVAALTQAASINWAVGNYALGSTGTLPSGTSLSGLSVYLIDSASQAGIVSAIEGGTFSGATAGVLDVGVTANTKGAVAERIATDGSLTAGTWYDYAILVFDTAADTYLISASLNQRAYTVGVDEAAVITFGSPEVAAGTGWTAVPEPTSMALLALGVAAVGLRRKLRK